MEKNFFECRKEAFEYLHPEKDYDKRYKCLSEKELYDLNKRAEEVFLGIAEENKPVFKKNVLLSEKAERFNSGKISWSLVDFESLESLVKVLEFGAKKYSRDNWKKGLYTRETIESIMRHVVSLLGGEYIDKESGLSHIGHIMANAMFLEYMLRTKKEFDNITQPEKNEK